MPHRYSPDHIRSYYDEYGEREWQRFDRHAAARVSLAIHQRFLSRWVRSGDRVLEVGAGPGRFTIELARLGARVVVSDISDRQLQLNREKVAAAGCEAAVEARESLDVTDLSRLPKGSFDAATAYGGPLSYVFERAGQALDQLLMVVRTGGIVLFSVMSRWGSLHQFLDGVLELQRRGLVEENRQVVEAGELVGEVARVPGMSLPHECHLFTWEEVENLLSGRACELLDAAAANFLSVRADQTLANLSKEEWATFLSWEERAGRARGALDAGTHILVAIKKLG